MKKYIVFYLGVLLLAIAAGGAWWNTQRPVSDAEYPTIGGLFGLTGFASFAGEGSRNGFFMAIEDSGMDVPYVIEDFQSDLATVATAATKLAEVDRVPVVIGPEWAEFAEVVSPVAKETQTLFISPWMSGEGDMFTSGYYFSATPSERVQTKTLLTYMTAQGHKKIALVYTNNAWSLGYVNVLKDELQHRTTPSIVQEFKVSQDQSDFRTQIARIKQLDPDAIYAVLATDNDQGLFSKQLQELGGAYQVYIPLVRAESDVLLGKFGSYMNGTIYPAPVPYKNAGKFREKYVARFGKEPTALSAATAYDMTALVLKAIRSGARTTDEIREYLLEVKNYDGYSNLINFEDNRVASEKVIIKQIADREPKVLSP